MASDEELMFAYQSGEEAAFAELYRRHSGKVYAYLRKHLDRPEAVDDVYQRVFLKFHQSRAKYDPKYSVMQWLFVIARSSLIDFVRQHGRHPTESLDDHPQLSQNEPDPTYSSRTLEVLEEETALLAKLSPEQRQVVRWRVLDELSFEEIGNQLGRSQEGVRQLLSRALRKLRATAKTTGRDDG